MTRSSWGIVVALALSGAVLAGCNGGAGAADETAPAGNQAANVAAASPADATDALLNDNDRAIEENKRLIAKLGEYQGADFPKYERLRTACEAKVGGTLADPAAPQVARCIVAQW